MRVIRFGLTAMLSFALSAPGQGADTQGVGPIQFLMMSDLHFDPMTDPKLIDRLSSAEPRGWPTIFDTSGDKTLARYGADSNWSLLHSALQQAKQALPNPAFVVVPGDFLPHNFRQRFDLSAADHSDAAYRELVRKTMQFVALQFEQTFPDTPILPAVGNDDAVCGNYQLQPGGPFLIDMLPIVRTLLGSLWSPGADRSWTNYGNYSVTVRGLRMIFPNSTFFSAHYRNTCGSPDAVDPGTATLAWLESELVAASQAHERVWLVYHIPPGIDGFTTLRTGSCPDAIVPIWREAYAAPFAALMRRYSDTIVASFAGHTHVDDFRLLDDDSGYYGFVLITPPLSPIYGQNPAFRTVFSDGAGVLLDQTTYELNLQEAGDGGAPPVWRAEYTFTQEWQLPRIDLASLTHLYAMVSDVPEDRTRWHTFYPVSSPVYWSASWGQASPQAVLAFHCATGHVLLQSFRQCYCEDGK